jgi:ATP-binding cassette subfamily D (ALD) long-chain fatty acid import protein
LGGGGAGTAGGSDGGGADQFITHDVARFCDTLSALYGNILKPVLDLVIFTAQLSSSLGPTGTIGLFSSYAITAYILRAVTPAFGRLAAVQARLEGEYRACVGRVGRDAEEIAFFRGGQTEKDILMRAYRKLMEHVSEVVKLRVGYLMVEDFVLKYLWSAGELSISLQ